MNVKAVELWLQSHAGLEASSLGAGTVARAARDRIEQTSCASAEDYIVRLETDAAERNTLIDRVVVPETWFFRDRAAIDALARHVVESWGPARPGAVFRLLCVPSSTGEEPYSLAMGFAFAGWPLTHLRIEAVDISRESLARAKAGVYGKNSFRGDDLAFRETFMTPAGPDAWRVDNTVRAPVTFEEGNLLAENFSLGRGRYDAIFCRNLLIYFDRDTQSSAIRKLDGLLAPQGWFAAGPAEPALLFEHGYVSLGVPRAFLLHREPPATVEPVKAAPPRRAPAIFPPLRIQTSPPPVARRAPAKPEPMPASAATLDDLQRLADAGQLREVATVGEAMLAREGASAALLFLLAVVAEADGATARAEALLRKTLYLDPHHAEALAHLALLAEKKGDVRGAVALRQRAQRALQKEAV